MSSTKRVALVTGASSGMGKETAFKFLEQGYTVYVGARRVERMNDLVEKGAIALSMDVTVEEDLLAAIDMIEKDHGGVDILVNNAGFGMYGAMEDTTIVDARYQFEVNLFGVARLTQLVLPHMRKQKWGKIVNVSSMGGKIYTPLGSWYHATKHALEGWSDCLRLELAPFGIDVLIIEPGAILTEFGDVMTGPMLERSGTGSYAEMARKSAEMTKREYDNGGGDPPSLIADIIIKAVQAARPKTRYAAGKYAKPMIAIRKWFGDRAFDKMIMKMI